MVRIVFGSVNSLVSVFPKSCLFIQLNAIHHHYQVKMVLEDREFNHTLYA